MSLRLVMVDGHAVFREGLREILARQGDVEVVGEARDGGEAVDVVRRAHADVILMEVALRCSDGITAVREITRRDVTTRILMLSMHEDEHHVARALAAGARGYAFKAQPAAELLGAIRTVHGGATYLPPSLCPVAIETLRRSHLMARQAGVLAPLSVRERDVFRLLVNGATTNAIAGALRIAPRTVETHRAHILKRLHVHSLAELTRFAAQNRLL